MTQEWRRELFIIGRFVIAGVFIVTLGLILTLAFYIGHRIVTTLDGDAKAHAPSDWRQ